MAFSFMCGSYSYSNFFLRKVQAIFQLLLHKAYDGIKCFQYMDNTFDDTPYEFCNLYIPNDTGLIIKSIPVKGGRSVLKQNPLLKPISNITVLPFQQLSGSWLMTWPLRESEDTVWLVRCYGSHAKSPINVIAFLLHGISRLTCWDKARRV